MLLKFDTQNLSRAKAALILYAVYRSREKNSPLNGLETWDRYSSFIHGACLKASNMPEFVEELCHKAKTESIKPHYLGTGDPVLISDDGTLIRSASAKDYKLDVLEDDSLLPLFRKETAVLIALVRERIQREKFEEDSYEESDD